MKVRRRAMQGDFRYEITWTTLAEYLRLLERRGVAPNVASFVGTGTIREHVVGLDDGRPTPAQLDAMRDLVRREMEAGALGIGSSLLYAPDCLQLARKTSSSWRRWPRSYQGRYITHMRSEGDRLLEAVDETIRVAREAGIPAEIYHLKAAGEANWPKLDAGDREGRSRPARGAEDHRRHVHVHGGRHRLRRLPAAVEPRGRLGTHLRSASATGRRARAS